MPDLRAPSERPSAVLFDFAATLFDEQEPERWIAAAASACGIDLDEDVRRGMAQRFPQLLRSSPHRERQRGRDLGRESHRAAYVPALRELADGRDEIVDALYAALFDDGYWRPRPGTERLLRAVRAAGARIAVVSNVPRDIRPVFARHGLVDQIDAYALSCEVGIEKPEAGIFAVACEALGAAPTDAIMVGDDPSTDGGAVAIGIPVLLLPPSLPDARMPSADAILSLIGGVPS